MKKHQRIKKIKTALLKPEFLILSCLGMIIVGCKKDEVRAYHVPREFDGTALLEGQFESDTPSEQAQSSEVVWVIPDAWSEVDVVVSMRVATFMTPQGIEVTLAAFPGDVGGLLANVNRWRGQVGLGLIEEQDLDESAELIEGTNSYVVDVAGPEFRLLGSAISIGDGQTWFAKTIGQADVVEQVKADLIAFSASFHLAQIEHSSNDGHNHAVETVPTTTEPTTTQPGVDWEQPSQWSVDPDASAILLAAYYAESGARITLTALGGEGGGMLGNINRWRGQLGLEPVQSLADQPSQVIGTIATLVDLVTEDGSSRIVVGVVPADSQTLFFKLTGSVSETDSELERFNAFIQGVGIGSQGTH